MAERIPQSVAIRVALEAYLTGTATPATGKTIAITISKNGAAYANPSAGATNAVEIGSGSYYVDLSTTDSGTVGPLIVKGTEGTIDTVKSQFRVVDPHNAGFDGVPAVTAGGTGGTPVVGTGTNNFKSDASANVTAADLKAVNAVPTSSVTTVAAVLGTTIAPTFTSSLMKVDLVDIAGSAVSTGSAQLGVNVVNFGGSAGTFSAGIPAVNSTQFAGTAYATQRDALVDLVWDEISSGHTTVGTFGKLVGDTFSEVDQYTSALLTFLNDYGNLTLVCGFSGDVGGKILGNDLGGGGGTIVGAGVWALDGSGAALAPASTALSNATWTNAKAAFLTGDAYARLGAPAGASVSADVAAIPNAIFATTLPASYTGSQAGAIIGGLSDIATEAQIAAAVWDLNLSTHLTPNTGGEIIQGIQLTIADFLDAPISGIPGAVWDLATSGHTTTGTFGAAMIAAGGSGDPWITNLPGSYVAGQAGYIIGHNIDALISSRLATAGYTTPPTANQNATTFADLATSGHTNAGTFGAAIVAGGTGDPWITNLPGSYTTGQAGYIIGTFLNAAINSRLASASYTAPDNADIATILATVNSGTFGNAALETLLNTIVSTAQAEPTGIPSATAAPIVKLAWLFKALIRELTVTANKKSFFDGSGNAEWSKALTDNGTTYTEAAAGGP